MRLDRNITVVGAHAEGEVGRVITGGVLPPRGATMFEQMMTLQRESAWLRDYPADVPWDEPELIEALVAMRHES